MEADEELRARLKSRLDPYWIHEHDVQAALAEVIAQDSKKLGSNCDALERTENHKALRDRISVCSVD